MGSMLVALTVTPALCGILPRRARSSQAIRPCSGS